MSALFEERKKYQPTIPKILLDPCSVSLNPLSQAKTPNVSLRSLFPHTFTQSGYELLLKKTKARALRMGVVFSGGQAPGGHNVIAGIWDTLQKIDEASELLGFLDGPEGIVRNRVKRLDQDAIDSVRNVGGFHLIGSGRTKIETDEQQQSALKTCQALNLDGIVVIGGDDSNTNAAVLAEYFLAHGCLTKVIGVPKTIDGDLKSEEIEISFGFDSACKTYAEMIGNIAFDALSAKKYYHIIKLMGRSASHITLECALATHPNLALIGEERKSLQEIVNSIAELIQLRKAKGKEYGVILIPEGLIEFMPEMHALILELNQLLASGKTEMHLSKKNGALFTSLPTRIQEQLLLDRDPHGNVALSQVGTEALLIELVQKELDSRGHKGKFTPIAHFFGYEGRSCFPSNFDANYCCALGALSVIGVLGGATGVICAMRKMRAESTDWEPCLVPVVQLMRLEERKGKQKPVIAKALVDLQGAPFLWFAKARESWAIDDLYRMPGPIQFFGSSQVTNVPPRILE